MNHIAVTVTDKEKMNQGQGQPYYPYTDDYASELDGLDLDIEDDCSTLSMLSFDFDEDMTEEKKKNVLSSSHLKRITAVSPTPTNDGVARTTKRKSEKLHGDFNFKQTIDNNNRKDLELLTRGDVAYVAYPKIDEDEDEGGQSHTSCRFRRGTVESIEQDRRSLTYGVSFDDGQYLEGIDKSLVMPEHRYLHKNLKKRLELNQRVVAAWWNNANDTLSPPDGWYPGVIKACKELKEGGKYGPDRYYDIKFDDGDKLDDIEDIFVFPESEYELLSRDNNSRWKGVRNVLDKDSSDRWAETVGYWEVKYREDGNEQYQYQYFSFLGDALRYYDDHVVSFKGVGIKRTDLNLPEEWVIDSEAESVPVRYRGCSISDDTSVVAMEENAGQFAPDYFTETETMNVKRRRVSQCSYDEASHTSTDRKERSIQVVEYVQPAKPRMEQTGQAQNSNDADAIIKRGQQVYAVLGEEGTPPNAPIEWLPGRVWDVKVKQDSSDGPLKTYEYDVIFENNQVRTGLDEMWVMRKEDYVASNSTSSDLDKLHWTSPETKQQSQECSVESMDMDGQTEGNAAATKATKTTKTQLQIIEKPSSFEKKIDNIFLQACAIANNGNGCDVKQKRRSSLAQALAQVQAKGLGHALATQIHAHTHKDTTQEHATVQEQIDSKALPFEEKMDNLFLDACAILNDDNGDKQKQRSFEKKIDQLFLEACAIVNDDVKQKQRRSLAQVQAQVLQANGLGHALAAPLPVHGAHKDTTHITRVPQKPDKGVMQLSIWEGKSHHVQSNLMTHYAW